MPTTPLERMKVDLCSQIEEMIAELSNAENSVKQGDFNVSAEILEEHLRLTAGDKQQHVDETRETEWQHECRIAGKTMREAPLNYLEPVTVPGVWTITEAGREHLEELRRADGLAMQ